MTYPQLIGLRVARRHRRGTPEEPLLDGVPLLLALLKDLERIEKLASELLLLHYPEQTARLDEIRNLMSLDSKPIFLDPGGEWRERLQAGIDHDRELIDMLLRQSTAEPWKKPVDMKPEIQRTIPEPPKRCSPPDWKWSAALLGADDALWAGHVQDKIGDHARRYRLPALELKCVEVTPAPARRSGSRLPAEAQIELSGQRDTVNARVQPGSGGLEATLWYAITQKKRPRPGWWPFGRAGKAAWETLFEPSKGRQTALLTQVVELLRDASEYRRKGAQTNGDLAFLQENLQRYSGGPTALLCGLLAHFDALSAAEQKRARELLEQIVANTEWPMLAACFVPLVSKLAPEATLAAALYDAMWRNCPSAPVPGDLLALAEACAKFRTDCQFRALVRAVCQSGLAGGAVRAAGREMRDLLGPDRPDALLLAVIRAIVGAIGAFGTGPRLHSPLKELRPIVQALDPGAAKALLNEAGQWLSRQPVEGTPEMWSANDETLSCIELVEIFQALAAGRPPWSEDALGWVRRPLPDAHGAQPSYPGTVWPLLRRWLIGDGLAGAERAHYQADVAGCWLRSYCGSGGSTAALTSTGQWLAESGAEPSVRRQLTDDWAAALDGAPQRACEALRLLLAPGMAPSSAAAFNAIRHAVDLEVWKELCTGWTEVVGIRWRQWVMSVTASGADWMSGWAGLAFCGVLFAPDSGGRGKWIDQLSGFASYLAPADHDACLSQFAWRVLNRQVCSLEDAFDRLKRIYDWQRGPERGASRLELLRWCVGAWQHAPNTMQQASAFRLQVAALAYARDPLEREVKELWPAVPLELLLNGHQGEFAEFFNLLKLDGLMDDVRCLDFERALLTFATPARPCLAELAVAAHVLFGSATPPLPPGAAGT